MLKKLICSVLIASCIFINANVVMADDEDEIIDVNEIIEVVNQSQEELEINSRIAIAYDRTSGTTIWGKNENKKTAMASTTKIMTAIVAIENSNLNDIVTISAKAAGTGGSRLKIKKGDKVSLNDLLYGLMLVSGNDAAVAIAEHVGGSVEGFSNLMNEKAKELHLDNTHFVTPHGLDNPEHYTTAFELAKIADYALKNETFAKIVGTKNCTITINGYPRNLTNTNELLGIMNGVTGVKTGFTNNAGRCLVTSVNRDNFQIITVILQADTKKIRTADSAHLIEYIYNNFELINIEEIVNEKFKEWSLINKNKITVNKAISTNLNLYTTKMKNSVIPVRKTEIDNIEVKISNVFYLDAPVEKDSIVGTMKIMCKDSVIDVVEIKNKNKIEKKNVKDYMCIFFDKLFA